MRYFLLVTDYDGTLAEHGQVTDSTLNSLKRFRESGRRLVLVTGRRLEPLLDIFPQASIFDRIVAENGALIYDPQSGEETLLSDPPPPEFAKKLVRRGVERIETGRSIVATWQPYEKIVLEVIREMGLDLQIIFNKDAVMILPSGMNKATGLLKALDMLGFSPINVVSVGDAENDEAMLRMPGASAAVDNALEPVKKMADIVLAQPRGAGVEELIDMVLSDDLASLRHDSRRGLVLGSTLLGEPFAIPQYGETVLVTGGPGGGKSKFAISVLEQLSKRGEQCCVIDPEGDYPGIPDSVTLGSSERAPAIEEVIRVLELPREHCIVSFFGIEKADRPAYFDRLHRAIADLRSRTGRPHWVLVDEAHYAAPRKWDPAKNWNANELKGMIFITAFHQQLSDVVLKHVDWIISIAEEPFSAIVECCERIGEPTPSLREAADREVHRALSWRRGSATVSWFSRLAPRADGQRHQHSNYEGEMDEHLQFVFRGPDSKLNLPVPNLKHFIKTANGVDDETWLFHLRRRDYSHWMREVIKDWKLSEEVEDVERTQDLSPTQSRDQITHHIEKRFKPKW